MPPAVVGGAVAAGGAIIGGMQASDAAKAAGEAQKASTQQGIDATLAMYNQSRADLLPYLQTGYSALPYLQYLATGQVPQDIPMTQGATGGGATGYSMESLPARNVLANIPENPPGFTQKFWDEVKNKSQEAVTAADQQAASQPSPYSNAIANFNPNFMFETPGYKWQLEQGQRAIDAAMAKRGKLNSSTAVNALADFTGNLSANEYNNAWNRLFSLGTMGQGTASSTGNASLQTGNALAGLYANQGAASANAINQAGQNRASLWSNLGALPLNIYSTQKYLNALG